MTRPSGRLSRAWSALTSTQRRRIILGSLVVVSLAARDVLLFLTTSGLFGVSEMAPRVAGPRPAL